MKIKHHYVPVFYLNYFTDSNGLVHVYDKDQKILFASRPENTAYEKHYYRITDDTGEASPDLVEDLIGRIETYAGQAIKKILAKDPLDEKEKSNLFAFMACMFTRGPNYRQNVENAFAEFIKYKSKLAASNESFFNSEIHEMLKKEFPRENISSEQIRQNILSGQYQIKSNPLISLLTGLESVNKFGEIFFNMKWSFLLSTQDWKFLSCDNPVSVFDSTHDTKSGFGIGFMNKNVEITFPISKDMCAIGGWKFKDDSIYVQAKNPQIKAINYRTISSAQRIVYSHEKNDRLLKAVIKYRGSGPKLVIIQREQLT
jgi:hypothetical protein